MHRLVVYHKQTEPLIRYYKLLGILFTVKGEVDVDHTSAKVFEAII